MPKKIPWNVKASAFYVLVLFLLGLVFYPQNVLARDPSPNKPRLKYQLMPFALGANPKTMLSPDNQKRSGIISFSCDGFSSKPQSKLATDQAIDYTIFLTALETDTLEKATVACNQRYSGQYTVVKVPFLKNNKQTSECINSLKAPYDPNCYESPLGDDFLLSANNPPGFKWVTPIVYSAQHGRPSLCGPNHDQLCGPNCIYTPFGPKETFVKLTNAAGEECVAPPYSTTGRWWDWLRGEITNTRNNTPQSEYQKLITVAMFFGIDGEGRPLKSDAGWTADFNINGQFQNYAAAVVTLVKGLYPDKVIRGHTDGNILQMILENDVELHRESLCGDGSANYFNSGINDGFGAWQGFANRFWITNTQGLWAWTPMYQSIMAALSMHTDMITGIIPSALYDDGKPDILKFTNEYIGRDLNDTPGVWTYLRETTATKDIKVGQSGKYGDYEFYLYRMEDLDNNHTVPIRASDINNLYLLTKKQIYSWNEVTTFGFRNNFAGRKNAPNNNYMSFDLDDGYKYAGKTGVSYNVRIVYLDAGTSPLKFQYPDGSNQMKEYIIIKNDTQMWQEKKFTLTDAYFNNKMSDYPYPTDFRLETNGTTVSLIEVRGSGPITEPTKLKTQVSCDLVENQTDDPKEGIFSIGLNRNFLVKARLIDNNRNPIDGERIMFTYNTEWNLAKSSKTQNGGYAFSPFSTTNRNDSTGFIANSKFSMYSIQAYYPGSEKYLPSRNDCYIYTVASSGRNDTRNTRMKITNIDTSSIPSTGKVNVSFEIYNTTGTKITSGSWNIGKSNGFYANDPNSQTISLVWNVTGYNPSSNNITLNMPNSTPPFTPNINLKTGWNIITLPQPTFPVSTSNLPSPCNKLTPKLPKINQTIKQNYLSSIPLTEGNKYNIFCSENSVW